MSLSEVEFAFYFFPVFILYWIVPRKAWLQNLILALASLVFYASWSLRLLPLFLLSTFIDYAVLRQFAKNPSPPDDAADAEKERVAKARRLWLTIGLVQNVGALVVFKYIGGVNALLKLGLPPIALPLGISFYTMSRLGVLIDTYYDRVKPVESPLSWLTFVSFFPQLIAGPIGRADLLEQYDKPRKLDPSSALKAIREVATGFVLKIYIAAHLGNTWVDPVFMAPGTYDRKAHWWAVIGYGGQVFADFAGYSLIALGVARAFAIDLPENFNFPYLATNPMDFWRRWHMSLNRWLFDYIYSFMVTSEGFMNGRLGLGLVIVMVVSGIWHGSAWTYVIWGLLHGLWLLAHFRYDQYYKSLCRKDRSWVARRKSKGYLALGWAATIGFFLFALIFFRSTSFGGALKFLGGLVSGGEDTTEAGTAHPLLAIPIIAAWHVFQLPMFTRIRERFAATPAPVRGLVLGAVIVLLVIFAPIGAGTFIYAQF